MDPLLLNPDHKHRWAASPFTANTNSVSLNNASKLEAELDFLEEDRVLARAKAQHAMFVRQQELEHHSLATKKDVAAPTTAPTAASISLFPFDKNKTRKPPSRTMNTTPIRTNRRSSDDQNRGRGNGVQTSHAISSPPSSTSSTLKVPPRRICHQ